jgi:hypothetical protein
MSDFTAGEIVGALAVAIGALVGYLWCRVMERYER